MTPRAILACPGRGSYAAASLGSLRPDHPWVLRAEQLRGLYGLEPLLDLDRSDRFDPSRHLQPIHHIQNILPLHRPRHLAEITLHQLGDTHPLTGSIRLHRLQQRTINGKI